MSRNARLGLLILLGLLVAVGALFVLASQGNLLSRTYEINARFGRVQGLKAGASVFYNGIDVGRVEEVRLPRRPGDPILVRMSIAERARPLIRQDSRAVIQTDGLVGNMVVSLGGGSLSTPSVADGGFVPGEDPFDLSSVTDRLFDSVARFDSVTVGLTAIMNDTRSGEGTLGKFLYDERLYEATVSTTEEFQTALRGFSGRADQLILVAENASRSVEGILAKVNSREGTVGRFINDDALYESFLGTAAELQAAAAQFQTVSGDVRLITDRFNQAAGWASLGAFRFSENMEALKHNFLFRGYFEDRGYNEMAPFEVREQAIAETLEDLQQWELRLTQQQRQIEAAQAEMERLRTELARRGVALPPPAATSAAPLGPTPRLELPADSTRRPADGR